MRQSLVFALAALMLPLCSCSNLTLQEESTPSPILTTVPTMEIVSISTDTTPPVLYTKDDRLTIYDGEGSFEGLTEFVTASDNEDGDISSKVEVFAARKEEIQAGDHGTYIVIFTATDSAGNKGSLQTTVAVVPQALKPFVGFWYREDNNSGFYFDGRSSSRDSGMGDYAIISDTDTAAEYSPGGSLTATYHILDADTIEFTEFYVAGLYGKEPKTMVYTRGTDQQRKAMLDAEEARTQELQDKLDALNAAPSASPSSGIKTGTIGSGMYSVGKDISAGTYKLTATGQYGGYWERTRNATGEFDDIISNSFFETTSYVTVVDGEYLTLSQCVGVFQK